VTVLRAVFVRTLRPGVSYQQFTDAWAPSPSDEAYPATVRVVRNLANDRQVMTILELDMSLTEFEAVRASLTRPDALERIAQLVETTELEGLYEDVIA
jgi:hypothetical protein